MTKIFKLRNLGIVAVAATIVGLIYLAVGLRNDLKTPGLDNNTTASGGTQFPGPTEDELRAVDEAKERLVRENGTNRTEGSNNTVTPVITGVNVSEVRGYVSGVVEDGGACTATFTKGTDSFTKSSTGFMNANTTTCNVIALNRSDFSSSGAWVVVLSYSSDNAQGSSSSVVIEVQ